jgi:hypothetical protein
MLRNRWARCASLAPALLATWSTTASAQPKEDTRAIEARKACAVGEVDKGIELLADYLARTDDITAVYNMGRCYQQNGMARQAVLQFREYLRKATDLALSDRREIEEQVKALETEQQPDSAGNVHASEPAPGGSRSKRTAGLVLAGVGVAGVAAGAYFGVRTQSAERDQSKPMTTYDDAGNTYKTLQFVMYGVGAAALIGGAALYYFGLDRGQQVAVLPSVSAHGAGALLRIRL